MNTEDHKVVSSPEKVPPEKPSKPWADLVELTDLLASVLGIIVTITAALGIEFIGSRILPTIPSGYLKVLMILLLAGVGLATMFSIAVNLYRRQVRQRNLTLEALREGEKEFFQSIEFDIATLLEEGGC